MVSANEEMSSAAAGGGGGANTNVIGNLLSQENSSLAGAAGQLTIVDEQEEVKYDDVPNASMQISPQQLQKHVISKKQLLYALEVKGKQP